MNDSTISRRSALGGALFAAGSGMAAPSFALARNPNHGLDLEDPASRARIRAKIQGSAAEETLHGLTQLHLMAYLNGGNVQPLMTMWNYTVTKWEPHSETSYRMRHYESGIYTKYNTEEVIDVWENPVTGEEREVWPFLAGPIKGELGPDGMVTGGNATVKPKGLGIHVVGDQVFIPAESSFSFPNPFTPEKYPKESAGPMFYWDSFSTVSALLKDVVNPNLNHVNSTTQFQNLVSWHPWLGMGGIEGRSFGRAYGTKLAGGFDEVPKFLQVALEKQTPEILNVEGWDVFRNDFEDYMKARG
jgi:hypothetical protein